VKGSERDGEGCGGRGGSGVSGSEGEGGAARVGGAQGMGWYGRPRVSSTYIA